jgi:hypothetical protein
MALNPPEKSGGFFDWKRDTSIKRIFESGSIPGNAMGKPVWIVL